MKKIKIALFLLIGLVTSISSFSQVTQNFEGTFPPTNWTQFGSDVWTQQTNSAYTHGGYGSAKNSSHSGSSALVTPRLTPTSDANTFKFWVRCMYNSWDEPGESINIKISTSGNGEFDTWTTLLTLDSSQTNATFQEKVVDLSAYIGQNIYIAIDVIGDNGNYFYFDDVTMPNLYVNPCASPSSVTASTLSTTASISWIGDAAAFYNVDYRIVGTASWTSTTSMTNSKNLTGLTSNTNYEIRVQKVCGAELSAWSTIATFHTICPSTSIPYLESFESITSNNQLPSCMTATNIGNYVFTGISTQNNNRSAHTGTKYMTFKYGCNDWVLTPTFDLTSGTNYEFSFWYKTDSTSYTFDSLKVFVGNGQSITAMNQRIGSELSAIHNPAYQKFSCVFTPTSTGIYSFGIHVVASSSPWYLTIDDISLKVPQSCPDPAFVNSSNNTANSINLTWDGTAPNYRVQYRAVGTTDWIYSDLISTPSTTLTGLSTFQSYEIQIRSICSVTDSSELSPIYIGTTAQIPATLPYATSFESDPIDWTLIQESQTNYWTAGSAAASEGTRSMYITNNGTANAYTTNATTVSHIYRDIVFPTSNSGFSLTFDWKGVGEYSYDFLKVYLIDPNTNPTAGVALNEANKIGASKYNSQSTWQNGVITLPSTLSGTTKRLVFSWINDNGGGTNPPIAIDNIEITLGSTANVCNTPTLLYTNNVTESTATLAWASSSTNFNVQYRLIGATTWTSTYIYATSLNISGLTSGSDYEFRVQAVCSATTGDTSSWSTAFPFSTDGTLPVCAVPTLLTTTSIAETSATIGWTSDATNFNILYREAGATTWTSASSSTNSLELTSLTDATTYEFKVQAICSVTAGDTSLWSDSATFITLRTLNCACPTNLAVSNLTATGAQLSWTNGGTETSWNIRFKESTATSYILSYNITHNPHQLYFLEANTAYLWNIQANCSATPGDTSCWSEEGMFTTTGVGISENSNSDIAVYSDNKMINILNKDYITINEVVIFDLLGQEVGRYPIKGNDNVLINTNLPASHYLVKVITSNKTITKKVTIK